MWKVGIFLWSLMWIAGFAAGATYAIDRVDYAYRRAMSECTDKVSETTVQDM